MTAIRERVETAEKDLICLKDQLVESLKELDETPDDESILAKTDDLSDRVEKSTANLDALKKAEKALAERAKPLESAPNIQNRGDKPVKDLFAKHALIKFVSFAEKKTPDQVIAERYDDDLTLKNTFSYVQKSAQTVATTYTAGFAAELVAEDARGFLETLRTTSVAAALAGKSKTLNFGGYNSIKIPRRNPLGATLTEPAWVAEGSPIPLTQFSFGSETINRYKLAAITSFTKELAERSTPAIEGILKSALSEAYADVLDSALLSTSAAVAGVRPKGLLSGLAGAATGAGAAAGSGSGAAVRSDLKAMLSYFQTNRTGSRPVLIINDQTRLSLSMTVSTLGEYLFRDEVSGGRLLGMEVISSANVGANTAILVDADALVFAMDAPEFDVSDFATLVEASADTTAATMAAAADGTIGTAGQVPRDGGLNVEGNTGAAMGTGATAYTARSLWQTHSMAIKMIAPTSWGVVRTNSVAQRTAVNW